MPLVNKQKKKISVEKKPKETTNIHKSLLPLAVPLSSLVLDKENARQHDDYNIESIKYSLNKFGQRKPIIVQESGMIVRAGNGTYAAALALGWKQIAAVIVDDDNLTAVEYAIADNRTAELSTWDSGQLEKLLLELKVSDIDISDIGFKYFDLQPLDENESWTDMPAFAEKNNSTYNELLGDGIAPHRSVIIHFRDEKDVTAFSKLVGQEIIEKAKFIWFPEKKRRNMQKVAFVQTEKAAAPKKKKAVK